MGLFDNSSIKKEATTDGESLPSETTITNTETLPPKKVITLKPGYDNLSPSEILLPYNTNRAFDEVMRCNGFGYQCLHYYRYGERKNCSLAWKKFKFSLSLSALSKEEKLVKIKDFEKNLDEGGLLGGSSLKIWNLRDGPPENFPPILD